MQKQIVQSFLAASVVVFAIAIGLAAFARPAANLMITIAGRGSAVLAVAGLALLITFKLADMRKSR